MTDDELERLVVERRRLTALSERVARQRRRVEKSERRAGGENVEDSDEEDLEGLDEEDLELQESLENDHSTNGNKQRMKLSIGYGDIHIID